MHRGMDASTVVLGCCHVVQAVLCTSPRPCSSHSAFEWQEQPWPLPVTLVGARQGGGAAAMEGRSFWVRLPRSVIGTDRQHCSHRAWTRCWRCPWWPGIACMSRPKLTGGRCTSSRVRRPLCSWWRQEARGSSHFSCKQHCLWPAPLVPVPGRSSTRRSSGPEWRLMYLSMLCCYWSWGCSAPLSNPAYPVLRLSPKESPSPQAPQETLPFSYPLIVF